MAFAKITPEIIAENSKDYDLLLEGVIEMFHLEEKIAETQNIDSIKQHYAAHPEDGLCHIYRPSDKSMVLCRMAGILAIQRIANRLIACSDDSTDLSYSDLVDVISKNIMQVAIDNISDDAELTRILLGYVEKSREKFSTKRYHFPCIVAHAKRPRHFCFGPVSFTLADDFIAEVEAKKQSGQLDLGEELFPDFIEQAKKNGWVASLAIPRCAPATSRKRAESAIEIALGILKIFIGIGYSKGMRLPHISPAQNSRTSFLVQEGNKIDWAWQGGSLESALVGDDWYQALPSEYIHHASHLLHAATLGQRSEIATRIIDAIRWFSDASFEVTAGVQVAKFVAAMERLTTTGNFRTHVFAKRIALLAADQMTEECIADSYREARRVHGLRCDVMHGSASQGDDRFDESVSAVHDLTRNALFRALEVHCVLDDTGKLSNKDNLIALFVKKERPFSDLFKNLEREFGRKPSL